MRCAPGMGCCESSFCKNSSAGGQLEQPSDVKSSTRIGWLLALLGEFSSCVSGAAREGTARKQKNSADTKASPRRLDPEGSINELKLARTRNSSQYITPFFSDRFMAKTSPLQIA